MSSAIGLGRADARGLDERDPQLARPRRHGRGRQRAAPAGGPVGGRHDGDELEPRVAGERVEDRARRTAPEPKKTVRARSAARPGAEPAVMRALAP